MKQLVYWLFILMVLPVTSWAQRLDQAYLKHRIQNIQNPASETLEIYLDSGGNIRIEGYSGQEVLVYDPSNANIEIRTQIPAIKILPNTKTPSIRVRIPYQMSVSIFHGNSDHEQEMNHIEARDIGGNVEIKAGNADISLSNINGSASIDAWKGNIEALFFRTIQSKMIALSTNEGNVDVTLPQEAKANLFLWTINGEIETNFTLEKNATANKITGTLNGGGSRVEIRVLSGNIYFRKR